MSSAGALCIYPNLNLENYKFMTQKESKPKKLFTYREQHAVIIITESEAAQKALFESLQKQGFKNLKIVSV